MLDKRLYKILIWRIKRMGEKDKHRYILDLKDSYLFYFPKSRKLLKKIKGKDYFKVVFRTYSQRWMQTTILHNLIKETYQNDETI